jgi:DNA-binding transcriptional ArsR family regulator
LTLDIQPHGWRSSALPLRQEVSHSFILCFVECLTGDQLVTYGAPVTDDDHVFKALADPTRRFLLDLLFQRDGRTLKQLESRLAMTRFGVMKHLKVLEGAGLIVSRRSGREKLHFLNAVPIRMIHDRWIDKYREREVSALLALKAELENKER